MSDLTLSRRSALAGLAAAGAAVAFPNVVLAAKDKVQVAVGSEHALVYLPWDVAKALGYFDDEGLDVTLTYTKGGSEAAQALVSGSVDYSGNAIDHAIAAVERGKQVLMIADFMNQPGISLLAKPENAAKLRNPKDWKGKTIGVTSVGSATHVLATWIAKRNGLGKDDIKILGIGGGSTMMSALGGGQVDVAFGNDPYATVLLRSNRAVSVADMFTAAVTQQWTGFRSYCFTGALTREDVIQKNAERTQKVVNALVRAQKFMATRSAAELANRMGDEMRGGTAAGDWAAAFGHSRPAYTNHGEIPLDGVRAQLETNSYFLDKKIDVKATQLFDQTFIERANKSVKV